ncbi:ribonuclease H [Rhizobium sp. BK251]|uniref:ribonuclease H family protein n=1 Tax=Rhizobium sp. BK251 TaxID=2512125 RepID=UPI0010D709E1|nr:ribonuclease H [Rhizobium sp. BK251]TCL70555.1 ribonuclease HI [Rhizobium sp. BK251]
MKKPGWKKYKAASDLFGRPPEPKIYPHMVDPTQYGRGLQIFCDGAAEPNPGVGGWGVAVYLDGVEIHSEHGGFAYTTNNIAELTGLIMAIRWAKVDGRPATIQCDSQYCVNGANQWRHGWKARGWKRGGPNSRPENSEIKNLDLWQAIDAELTGAKGITIQWCKGHAGIVGNERADELSNIGMRDISGNSRTDTALSPAFGEETGDYLTDQCREIMR